VVCSLRKVLARVSGSVLYNASDFKKMMKARLKFRMINSVIQFPFRVTYASNLHIGPNVFIGKNAWFDLSEKCHLYIGEGTHIGRFCQISGGWGDTNTFIRIGKNVLIGERVFITESDHNYEDVTQPIIKQGSVSKGSVTIEDECWIGIGACILPNVTIGKHSVVGANAVVIHDIPPYSVAVGNPAKVVKKYDFKQKKWIRVKSSSSKQ